jgi:hypothetical protein
MNSINLMDFAALSHYQPYWALLALKGLDFATGLARAIVARDVQPAKLVRLPGSLAILTATALVCVALSAVSDAFAPVVAVTLVTLAGAEAASIVQNLHDIYVLRGEVPPSWLVRVTTTLKTLESPQGTRP